MCRDTCVYTIKLHNQQDMMESERCKQEHAASALNGAPSHANTHTQAKVVSGCSYAFPHEGSYSELFASYKLA